MPDSRKYFDPRVLNKIAPLELRARWVVEGFLGGLHRSPYRGVSVEFAEHREYVPGDDIRFLDWKVLGRSDRFFVKEFEVETNLACHFFVDTSESMRFGSGEVSKFDYAASVAAALSFLALRQGDAASLVFFSDEIEKSLPAASGGGHLAAMLQVLGETTPAKGTTVGPALHALAERLPRRGIVLILSDLLDDPAQILAGLEHLKHDGHEVIVFHILDRAETDFPYDRLTLFEGMEGQPNLLIDPKDIRETYLAEMTRFRETLRKGCLKQRVDYETLTTDTSLDVALVSYLGRRAAHRKGRG